MQNASLLKFKGSKNYFLRMNSVIIWCVLIMSGKKIIDWTLWEVWSWCAVWVTHPLRGEQGQQSLKSKECCCQKKGKGTLRKVKPWTEVLGPW